MKFFAQLPGYKVTQQSVNKSKGYAMRASLIRWTRHLQKPVSLVMIKALALGVLWAQRHCTT